MTVQSLAWQGGDQHWEGRWPRCDTALALCEPRPGDRQTVIGHEVVRALCRCQDPDGPGHPRGMTWGGSPSRFLCCGDAFSTVARSYAGPDQNRDLLLRQRYSHFDRLQCRNLLKATSVIGNCEKDKWHNELRNNLNSSQPLATYERAPRENVLTVVKDRKRASATRKRKSRSWPSACGIGSSTDTPRKARSSTQYQRVPKVPICEQARFQYSDEPSYRIRQNLHFSSERMRSVLRGIDTVLTC